MRPRPATLLLAAGLLLLTAAPGLQADEARPLTLAQVVERVLKANGRIKASHQRVEAAREAAAAAHSALFPRLSLSYRFTSLDEAPYFRLNQIPGNPTFPYGGEHEARWGVELFQPLFTGWGLVSRERLRRLQVDVARVEERQARLDLILRAKVGFYRLLLAEKGVEVTREAVEALEAHLRDAKGFFRQGLIPRNDLLRSQVALAQARQELARARADLETARDRLAVLMDLPVGTPIRLAPPARLHPPLPRLEALEEAALRHRPEREALALKLREARMEQRIVRSRRLPQVGLLARYEQVGQDLLADDNAYANHSNALVGVEARWDIFQFGRRRHREAEVEHRMEELKELLRDLDREIELQVKQAWLQARVARQNLATASTALGQARENYRITNLQYREQLAASSDLLDARTYLSQAEMNYYGAIYGYLTALARLQRAVGGPLE